MSYAIPVPRLLGEASKDTSTALQLMRASYSEAPMAALVLLAEAQLKIIDVLRQTP